MGKVSVIMPVFNSANTLHNSVLSVLSQSYPDFELLIVDDCSDDNSYKLALSLAEQDKRIRCFRLPCNSGAAVARNKAIAMACGRFIAFLDADDLWLPDKLEKQVEFMLSNHAPISFSSYYKIDGEDNDIGFIGVPERVRYQDLLKTCYIGCLTAMYDTHHFGKVLMPEVRKRQDYALWLTLLKHTDYAYGISQPLAKYRIHKGSVSYNKFSAARHTWRVYRECEKLPVPVAAYYFTHYALRGVLRKYAPAFAWLTGVMH
ncbi:glycosyltransferase family 2 protein [Oceanimonas baumannii]|uniref:glycosyltransferase family 2 protein n=1 Tax=Oceanimonas baumannii TaxID=129578 RepID=UPI003A8D8112